MLNEGHIEQLERLMKSTLTRRLNTSRLSSARANIIEATVKDGMLDVGSAQLTAALDHQTFQNGDCVKIVFRPEDVVLSKSDFVGVRCGERLG